MKGDMHVAGLKVVTDGRGFHRSKNNIDSLESRTEILLGFEQMDTKTLRRVVHMLLMIFSNQAIIMDALGELQEGQGNAMTALDDLTTAVNGAVGIEQAAVDLLATLESQLQAALAELAALGTPVDDSPALQALTATLTGGAQKLSDAINAAGGIGGSGTTTTVPPTTDGSGIDSGTLSAPSTDDSGDSATPTV